MTVGSRTDESGELVRAQSYRSAGPRSSLRQAARSISSIYPQLYPCRCLDLTGYGCFGAAASAESYGQFLRQAPVDDPLGGIRKRITRKNRMPVPPIRASNRIFRIATIVFTGEMY
jgi:hypothetical protein